MFWPGWAALPVHSKRMNTASKLAAAGFEQIEVEPTRLYRVADAREFLAGQGIDVDALAPQVDEKFMSAFIRAVKPSRAESRTETEKDKPCCGPTCCN